MGLTSLLFVHEVWLRLQSSRYRGHVIGSAVLRPMSKGSCPAEPPQPLWHPFRMRRIDLDDRGYRPSMRAQPPATFWHPYGMKRSAAFQDYAKRRCE